MPFFYGIYNGSMRTLYEKVGLFYTVKSGNVGNGVWFGNGTSIHIIPTGYLINWFSEKC
jgi:hypothetical protein